MHLIGTSIGRWFRLRGQALLPVSIAMGLLIAGLSGCGNSPGTAATSEPAKDQPARVAESSSCAVADATEEADDDTNRASASAALPRLVDLGATKCIPCKKMEPILESLKEDFQGKMEIAFIDVWENPDAGKAYRIKLIPTQIFFDAEGNELYRHQGFYSREDILGKWKELGVNLE
jgi:thioredoxin 1